MRRSGWMITFSVALLAAACGGGKDTTDETTTTSSSTTTSSTTTTTVAPTTTTTSGPPTCLASQLSAVINNGDAGAGQRYANLAFTNNGTQPCTMFGYPGMQLFTASTTPVPTHVVRNSGTVPKHLVTLAGSGGQAFTTLHWGVMPGPGEPQDVQCQPTPDRIQLTPPNETQSLFISWNEGFVCQGGTIDVNPMQPGPGPQM